VDPFVRKLITEWRKLGLPFSNEVFVVALSGGADSCALTMALKELQERQKLHLRFVLAHFNHGLRGSAGDKDEEFVRNLAVKFGFEIVVKRGNLSSVKSNLEENARNARYEFLAEITENLNAYGVLTAHTINDQAETFLMNLLRGSGTQGLSAMKPIRTLKQSSQRKILLIRPLLRWAKRYDTESFCRKRSIEFRLDSMNEQMNFTRVKIRKKLLPLLEEFNPKIIDVLARTARNLASEAEVSSELLKNFVSSDLRIRDLKSVSSALRQAVLRAWLEKELGNLKGVNSVHIEAIEKLITSRKSGRIIELPKGICIEKKAGKIYLYKN
jgi:tRNA(Ile)-lysidine synthase